MGISRKQALECFQSKDLIGIGMEADAVRLRLHPEGVVSYAIGRDIDCAAVMGSDEFSSESICELVGETLEMGGTGVSLQGSVAEGRTVGWFERLFAEIKRRHPSVWLQGLSAPEVLAVAEASGVTLQDAIARLRDAGLDSIACDDAQPTGSVAEWVAVHRAAHGLGMPTLATMAFGSGETLEQRVDTLAAVRQLQQETGGFAAFVPVAAAAPSGRDLDSVTAVEQLKTLAVARIFLDNIQNIQLSAAAQGLKVLQTALRFGANDAGSVTPQANGAKAGNGATAAGENAVAAANRISEEDLRRIIRDAGFQPVQRDTPYRTMFFN